MSINKCSELVRWVRESRGLKRFDNQQFHFEQGIEAVESCRNSAEDQLAIEVIVDLEKLPISSIPNNASRLLFERQKIANKEREECPPSVDFTAQTPKDLPPIWIRGWNFATAMLRHGRNGLKMCSQEMIDRRLSICQACPKLKDDHCSLCGCACNEQNRLLNKLALESEKCPLSKW